MAPFCTICGRPLEEGMTCNCTEQTTETVPEATPEVLPAADAAQAETSESGTEEAPRKSGFVSFLTKIKDNSGLGDFGIGTAEIYEKNKLIVPDVLETNEGEVPVKQYNVAYLKNRMLGIPFSKAVGRIQVTNKRVVFRAPGRNPFGRTTLQHEFAIDELAGLEARTDRIFALWAFWLGLFTLVFGTLVFFGTLFLVRAFFVPWASILVSFLICPAAILPFLLFKKKGLLKLLFFGMSAVPMLVTGFRFFKVNVATGVFCALLVLLGFIYFLLMLYSLFCYSIRPNLVLGIKAKSAHEVIEIKRKHRFEHNNESGFSEVLPAEDIDECIREINAMIIDVQKLGDYGIEKWKSPKE